MLQTIWMMWSQRKKRKAKDYWVLVSMHRHLYPCKASHFSDERERKREGERQIQREMSQQNAPHLVGVIYPYVDRVHA